MSILIKGMTMPKTCGECIFRDYDYCVLTDKLVEPDDEPLKDCPVEEVKE